MNRVDMNILWNPGSRFDVLMRAPNRLKADYFKHAILKYLRNDVKLKEVLLQNE